MSQRPKRFFLVPAWNLFVMLFLLWSAGAKAQPSGARAILKIDPQHKSDTIGWARPRNLPGKGMMQDFKGLFKTIHGKNNTALFKKYEGMAEIAYDSITGAYYSKSAKPPGLISGKEVVGWHPYWMKDAYPYYPYKLLSTIAFFAYDVDPQSGSYTDADAIGQWLTTPMIDSAKQHNAKVLLTLTSYGEVRNNKLLNNENAWLSLSDSVKALLRKRNADGIDLDFSGILPSMKNTFADFVSYLKNKLGDSVTVMLEIPYHASQEVYDYARLKSYVDIFVIQGFDRDNGTCNGKPVPPAPLLAGTLYCTSLQDAVENCIGQGVSPANIVVSLPLYGAHWRYRKPQWRFVENLPYEDIRGKFSVNGQQFIEDVSGSSMIRVGQGEDHDVIWYEGQGSMNRKFRWILDKELQGAGLWGLGYDGGNPEIWTAVQENFSAREWQSIQPIGYGNGKAYSFMSGMQKYRKIIGASVFMIICFFLAGLLLSCLDWRVRDAFFHNNSYRGLLAGALIVALALVVYLLLGDSGDAASGAGDSLAAFCYGVLVGGGIVYLVNSLYLHYRKRLH